MEPQIVDQPGFIVIGMHYHGRNEQNEIFQMWQALGARMPEIPQVINPEIAYGLSDNVDHDTGEFDYVAGLEVREGTALPEGMVQWEVAGGTYAVFPCTLPTLGEVFDAVYSTWLPKSGYQRADGPEVERYDEHFDPQDPDSQLEVFIPIRQGSR